MLPNERHVRHLIARELSTEFADAKRLLAFGLALPGSKDLHAGRFPYDSVVTTFGLFVKATITFRAIIGLCEHGLDRSAMPLSRSLFENLLNLTFLLRRRVALHGQKLTRASAHSG